MAGVASETLDVIPARNRSANHINAKSAPIGIRVKIIGIVTKLKLNEPLPAISVAPATPKKVTAAGITILAPSTTSMNSFVIADVMPESTTSWRFLR